MWAAEAEEAALAEARQAEEAAVDIMAEAEAVVA